MALTAWYLAYLWTLNFHCFFLPVRVGAHIENERAYFFNVLALTCNRRAAPAIDLDLAMACSISDFKRGRYPTPLRLLGNFGSSPLSSRTSVGNSAVLMIASVSNLNTFSSSSRTRRTRFKSISSLMQINSWVCLSG